MEKTLFTGSFVSFAEQQPTQASEQRTFATMTFIFTDFRPNGNNQAVPKEERDNLLASALYKPVKIAYSDHSWAGHANAIPIGPITRVFDVEDALVAEAVIWKQEFPDVYQLLSSAAQEDPTSINFSWEMQYAESEVKDGVEWLRGCNVLAATIVQNPAYQGRTHLIALSEQISSQESETSQTEVPVAASDLPEMPVSPTDLPVTEANRDAIEAQLHALQLELEQLRAFQQSVLRAQAAARRVELLKQVGAVRLAEQLQHHYSDTTQCVASLQEPVQWMSVLSDDDFALLLRLLTYVVADKTQAAFAETHATLPTASSAQVVVPDVLFAPSSALPSPKEVAQLLREYRSHHVKR